MLNSDKLIKAVGANIQEKASLIWAAADTLRGPYKPHEYGLVILPMTIIKRFNDCLAPTHDAVLAAAEKYKALAVKDGFLRDASGYPFYNTSKFTFEKLKADPENIEDNFRDYLNGFSDNVQDILTRMKFSDQIERLSDPDAPLLYQVVCDFCKPQADMTPDKIKAVDMGYIFENLIQRFSESYNEDAGAHFTSRDIVYVMTDLLIQADPHVFDGERITKTVYDQAMGTSQMLGCTEERLRQLDAEARVTCYGQEFNPFTFGIAKASALIRGKDDTNMRFGDTLSADKFEGFKFDYCISNPPFGDPWNPQAAAVEKEFKTAGGGRFPVEKLPAKGDGQMLFVLNGLSKLKDDGVMAIIQDASPLYKGKPGSGEDSIRRYVLENDYLDAIVQLPCDSFYNTGIATYVWLFSKAKVPEHRDHVLLIDASQCFEKRRKGIGDKKNDITKSSRDLIVQAYSEYRDGTWVGDGSNGQELTVEARLMQTVEFGFNRVVVEAPVVDEDGEPILNKRGKMQADKAKEDTEDIPLTQDIDAYIEREVRPYNKHAWVDKKKTKVGYTIPFTRVFYKYTELEPADEIAKRILEHEKTLERNLEALFGEVR
ncbi:N-6 DNA Methylase [Coriobacteriaceae bacterium BV3Ac1]|nr:N-6 DNA Methylase [Coriobacteriaceae bacterium BV3Ac1]